MSKELIISNAKPNPAGKDKSHNIPLAKQLQGEWVQVVNASGKNLRLDSVSLDHTAFGPGCINPQNSVFWPGEAGLVLNAGEILRIHSGHRADANHMLPEDWNGAHKHVWTEQSLFKLNNGACGDELKLWYQNAAKYTLLDNTSYDPYPPEGVVLVREGDKLVTSVLSYYR